MGRENTYMKVTAAYLVQQVRLQAVIAGNSHVFFPMGTTASLLFFYIASGESVSPVGAVVASWCC